jgi:hypothetical protein
MAACKERIPAYVRAAIGAIPLRMWVDGAPFQPKEIVRVVASVESGDMSVDSLIGKLGVVEYLEYDCGCGQTFPDDPMIGVRFSNGDQQEFWREELSSVPK